LIHKSHAAHLSGRIAVLRLYAVALLIIGVTLSVGGGELVFLGGSFYYLLTGLALCAAAALLWLRRAAGAAVYGWMLLGTLIWAVWESGDDAWSLAPRLVPLTILGVVLLIPWIRRAFRDPEMALRGRYMALLTAVGIALGAGLHALAGPARAPDPLYQTGMMPPPSPAALETDTPDASDWEQYGNDPGGTRFSPLTQLTRANVGKLAPAWSFRVGARGQQMEVTPLKIDRMLYLCSSLNDVIALDATSGKQIWRFDSGIDKRHAPAAHCRGVAYYRAAATGACAARIITATVDARLIAVDAKDGAPCRDFGENGQVSLVKGMGEVVTGYYFVTSAPAVARGNIIVGGWVADGQYWGEPSGVIRAFDAVSGRLAWAWDMGRPDRHGEPPPGETYTRATPNSWGPMSVDEKLGLVFVPTGNATPDFFGAQRRPFDDQYSSSVVALDAATGEARWSFQTAHHDLWDYDVPAQPTLVDFPTVGGRVPALLQTTKRGELFVLDRATGIPLTPVHERPAPQRGAAPGERLAPTQPYSDGMPSFRGADLVEADMWGLTPLDELWCRLRFREARYDGPATPPGLTSSVQMPGDAGGSEWGGVAVDLSRRIVVVNSNNLPFYVRLMPRAAADKLGLKPFAAADVADPNLEVRIAAQPPQLGTPFAVLTLPFVSPLYVPCTRPPFGRLSAVDLDTGKLLWSQPLGTAQNVGPLGIASHLPFVIGTINFGGSVVTGGGLTFIAASTDEHLRAFETATGRLLWEAPLAAGGHASPMTYMAGGRQFVVAAAGGNRFAGSPEGDYIVAYALPNP
jgi:quinoprotein glucose dehydrogenase